jgi:hypothetical protein
MSKLIIVGGKLAVVTRDVEEDDEQYWDRAWCFVSEAEGGASPDVRRTRSLKRPHERRGVVYCPLGPEQFTRAA